MELVLSHPIEYMWVKCSSCGAEIERVKTFANRQFTCYDCKRERRKKYDAQPKQKEARRAYARHELPAKPITEEETRNALAWQSKQELLKDREKRLRRFQVRPSI